MRHTRVYAHGRFEEPFKLKIDASGYSFDKEIQQQRSYSYSTTERLEAWFEHATPAGFGDIREQVTKVDESVRKAREFNSEQFSVEPSLVARVEEAWAKNFIPSKVRAEPYKIQMYDCGGHFKAHRDTPEPNLVGTFLLGLGDNATEGYRTSTHKCLVVAGERMPVAKAGTWIAFYPDVAHEVTQVKDIRAVLAFKIFRVDPESQQGPDNIRLTDDICPPPLLDAIKSLVSGLQTPFGLILDRKYCQGTTRLSGIDALVLECLKTHRQDLSTDILPIALQTVKHACFNTEDRSDDPQIISYVHPFTRGVIEAIVRATRQEDSLSDNAGKEWRKIKGVPFFGLGDSPTKCFLEWDKQEEDVNYTGNEADGTRDTSVYLSYALLCFRVGESTELMVSDGYDSDDSNGSYLSDWAEDQGEC